MRAKTNHKVGWFAIALATVSAMPAAENASALDYPVKPIRMIVAVPPAGPADTLSRLISPQLTQSLGQTIVIDNRAGANGNIAYEMTARAVPDGYTITAVAAGVAINPSLYRDVKFDPVKDFAAITQGISVPNILVVHPSVAATTVQELITLAKARAGQLVFASAGNGTSGHLALEQLKILSGIQVVHVPYKGGGPALTELIAGQVQALFSIALVAMPQVKAGKIRALAISSARRSAIVPELPTVAETGFAGFECVGWFGWIAPARVPAEIVARLNREIIRVLNMPEMHERLLAQGADPVANSPQAFAAFIRSEHDKWAKVIKQAAIRAE
ncbi:MAG TPA: tripartite tricarboxylate transporter substrate binding protein [Burkholderiales bacterium]|nr:tripartite tricarboxylate transporter substrate binding protein [Burkholderiales bacterium]